MTLTLRPYQTDALNGLYRYWREEGGNALVVVPTGGGKSLIIAKLMQELLEGWPDMRVACATHVRELIEQNHKELLNLWPSAPSGIYSAGLGRRETQAQILFLGIQSVHNKVQRLGHIDLLFVDEAHLIPRNANTMYGRFIAGLRETNPDLKVVGLTATPYRLDTGRLDEGDNRLFDKVAYDVPIRRLIDEGWLCPLVSKAPETMLDTAGVGKRGGDYIPSQLQAAVDVASVTRAAVEEIVAYGQDRRGWLLFCSGVEHARHVRDEIRRHGVSCETVTGDTPKGERDRIVADFRAGRLRALTNANVLTTGFNVLHVDLLGMLRPTESTGLYVQMVGRGSRNAEGKENCLVLDFAGVVRKHGPVDAVDPKAKGESLKVCPECQSILPAAKAVCPDCNFVFTKECTNCHYEIPVTARICPICHFEPHVERELKIHARADTTPVLSDGKPEWIAVKSRSFSRHEKPGSPDSLKVTYFCGLQAYSEWICLEHEGYPRTKAEKWWRDHAGLMPYPDSVSEALARLEELAPIEAVRVRHAGRFWEVVGHRTGPVQRPLAADLLAGVLGEPE